MRKIYPESDEINSTKTLKSIFRCFKLVDTDLTSEESRALDLLKQHVSEPADLDSIRQACVSLWRNVFPERDVPEKIAEDWKSLGFQNHNPATDIRSGIFVLKQLEYFASKYPIKARQLIEESNEKYYPFAVAAFNVSFMITRFYGLADGVDPTGEKLSASNLQKSAFAQLLLKFRDDVVYNTVFCVAMLGLHER